MFNSHQILVDHYAQQLRADWHWDKIAANCRKTCPEEREDGVSYAWLGTVFALTPSGKVYAFWTTNQTRSDVRRDEAWWDALEQVAGEHGLFVGQPECCDGDGVYVGMTIDEPEIESVDD